MKTLTLKFNLVCVFAIVLSLLVLSMPIVGQTVIAQTNSTSSQLSSTSQVTSPNSLELANRDRAVSSLGNLFYFDTSRYNVTLTTDYLLSPQMSPQFGGLTPENLEYNLTAADGNTITEDVVFLNGSPVHYLLYYNDNATNNNASPYYTQTMPTALSEKTSTFLNRYQNFTGASYIQPMLDMLSKNSIDEMLNTLKNTNTTSTSVIENNLKMELDFNDYSTEIVFMPHIGGVDYPNCINLDFLKGNGNLDSFTDNWNLYKIGNTDVNVSRDEAIDMAWKLANNITTVSIGDVGDVAIHFSNNPEVNLYGSIRNNMTAFPFYLIQIPTDKIYYTVDGVEVGIWADTGQVAFCQLTVLKERPCQTDNENQTLQYPICPSSSTLSSSSNTPLRTNSACFQTELIFSIVGSSVVATIALAAIVVKKKC